jgi:hypothetical protein
MEFMDCREDGASYLREDYQRCKNAGQRASALIREGGRESR